MLGHLNAFVQRLGGVPIQDGHGALGDNRSGIDTGIHKMDRATGDPDAVVERLLPRFQSRERRQE